MAGDNSTCRSCGAPVRFVKSARSDAHMILDAKPVKNIVLVVAGHQLWEHESQGRPLARVVDVYTDHHVTCPQHVRWKR